MVLQLCCNGAVNMLSSLWCCKAVLWDSCPPPSSSSSSCLPCDDFSHIIHFGLDYIPNCKELHGVMLKHCHHILVDKLCPIVYPCQEMDRTRIVSTFSTLLGKTFHNNWNVIPQLRRFSFCDAHNYSTLRSSRSTVI